LRPVPCASNAALRDECLALFGKDLGTHGGIRLQDKGHVVQKLLACNAGKAPPESCRILWDKRTDDWHFKFVYDLPPLDDPDPRFETKRVVATDPGVRRFQTYYCPATGEFGELFRKGRDAIERRCVALDDIASRTASVVNLLKDKDAPPCAAERRRAHRTLRSLRRQSARGRRRLRGFVECGHYAAARFLLGRHEVVVAPKLQTAELADSETRVMGSGSVRAMLTFSHHKFQQRLESAAYRFPGRVVVSDGGEPGTSRTCTHCGRWHGDLGGSKFFCCPACGLEMNRDVAGARNNFFAAWQKHAAEKVKEEQAQRRKRPASLASSSAVSESTASSPSGDEEGVTLSPQRP
jgi:transposase